MDIGSFCTLHVMNIDGWLYYPRANSNSNSESRHPSELKLKVINGVNTLVSGIDTKKPVVIFYHGNACSAEQTEELVKVLSSNYLIPEYPGYSGTKICAEGTTIGIINDVQKLTEWLAKKKISVHIIGQSIGTGPACHLAELLPRRQVRSLQLISPFTTLRDLINDYTFLGGYLVPDYYYDNVSKLTKLAAYCPINIYHGVDDNIISVSHSKQIQQKIAGGNVRVFLIEGLNHNDIVTSQVLGRVTQFLD